MKQTKPFPWRCVECHKREVSPCILKDYVVEIRHDGRTHSITVPELKVPKCSACGAVHFDIEADRQVVVALRAELRLLSPESIRMWREDRLKLMQKEFARRIGVAPETVCRWESGAIIQSRANDNLMRLFFGMPEVREALADPSGHFFELEFQDWQGVFSSSWVPDASLFDPQMSQTFGLTRELAGIVPGNVGQPVYSITGTYISSSDRLAA